MSRQDIRKTWEERVRDGDVVDFHVPPVTQHSGCYTLFLVIVGLLIIVVMWWLGTQIGL